MDADGIRRTLRLISPNSTVNRNGDWFQTACPFAQWKHPRGSDRNPSFGIVASSTDVSIYHCFTCKSKGTIEMLWEELEVFHGADYSEHIDDARETELFGPKLPRWADRRSVRDPDSLGRPIAEEIAIVYEPATDSGPALRYLLSRGIGANTARGVKLRYDIDDGHGVPRILFDVRDSDGRLFGFTGRALDGDVEPRVRDYYGLDKRLLLLGENYCDQCFERGEEGDQFSKTPPVVIVEGPFDWLKVVQAGYDGLAVMHSGLTPQQLRTVKRLGRPVVLFYDNDEAGEKGADQAAEDLRGSVRIRKVRYPRGYKDPGSMPTWAVDFAIRRARMF